MFECLLKHDDRLDLIFNSYSLRLYGHKASMPIYLSHFVNMELVFQWYYQMLVEGFTRQIDDVVESFKTNRDPEASKCYSYDLPWLPRKARDGSFYSQIPEYTKEFLDVFIQSSIIRKQDAAKSLTEMVSRSEGESIKCLLSAIGHLVYVYARNLEHKDWLQCLNNDEIDEYSEFVVSAANDLLRMCFATVF